MRLRGEFEVLNGPAIDKPRRLLSRHIAWLTALLLAALAVGLAVAGSDPDWAGTEPENLSNSPNNLAGQPHMASSPSDQIVVAWSDERAAGEWYIYTALSADNGHTWSSPQAVSETTYASRLPHTTFAEERAFVTWVTGDITQTLFETELTTTHEVRPLPSPVKLVQARPRLAGDSQRLHAVFHAGSNQPDIYYTSRLLTDASWPTATIIHTHTATGAWYPALAIGSDEQTLHTVWEERSLGDAAGIAYMSSTVGSGTWSPPVDLSTGITLSFRPALATDPTGNVHVVWGEGERVEEGKPQDQYVRYTHYDVATGQWISPAVRIDDTPVQVNEQNPTFVEPSLALYQDGGQIVVCVAWHGFRQGGAAEEVLVSCSQDGGDTWPAPKNVSRSYGDNELSLLPSIAFDGQDTLHVAWQERAGDNIRTNYEIYHARELDNKVFLPLVLRNYP